jgi:hypothetical protein
MDGHCFRQGSIVSTLISSRFVFEGGPKAADSPNVRTGRAGGDRTETGTDRQDTSSVRLPEGKWRFLEPWETIE